MSANRFDPPSWVVQTVLAFEAEGERRCPLAPAHYTVAGQEKYYAERQQERLRHNREAKENGSMADAQQKPTL